MHFKRFTKFAVQVDTDGFGIFIDIFAFQDIQVARSIAALRATSEPRPSRMLPSP
jgi:hypothetical protein